jgi:hypothetical protein
MLRKGERIYRVLESVEVLLVPESAMSDHQAQERKKNRIFGKTNSTVYAHRNMLVVRETKLINTAYSIACDRTSVK